MPRFCLLLGAARTECGAAPCTALRPTHPKTLKGNSEGRQVPAPFLFAVRGVVTPQVAAKTTRCCKAERKLRSALGSTLSLARFYKHGRRMRRCDIAFRTVRGPPCGKSRNTNGKPLSVAS